MAVINKNGGYNALPIAYKRGNPIALDTTAVWYSMDELEAYASSGATAYVGQIVALVDEEEGMTEAYMITDEAGTLVKLAQTTASGDLASDVAALQTAIGHPSSTGVAATGIFARIEELEESADFVGTADLTGYDENADPETLAGFVNILAFGDEEGSLGYVQNMAEENASDIADLQALHATGKTVADEIDSAINTGTGTAKHSKFAGYDYEAKVDTLIGDDASKSVRTIAAEEIAAKLIPEDAQDALDTLQEIADWIQSHPEDVGTMNTQISAIEAILDGIGGTGEEATVVAYVSEAIDALKEGEIADAQAAIDALEEAVGTASDLASPSGSVFARIASLKTIVDDIDDTYVAKHKTNGVDDRLMTAAEGTKLAGIEEGAEVNIIESVKVNGTALTPSSKAVDVTVATGSTNGTIKVNGTDISVKGLDSAAYTPASDYATAAQGAKADTAIQEVTIAGTTLTLDSSTVSAATLKTALGIDDLDDTYATDVELASVKSAILGQTAGVDYSGTVKGAYEAAASAKADVIGASTDAKSANTVYGAKAYADDAVGTAKAELEGNASTDTAASKTIAGAKKYADAAITALALDDTYVKQEENKRLMTAAEGTKLAGISEGANKVEATAKSGKIKIDGSEVQVIPDNVVTDADYEHITVTSSSVSDGTNTFEKYVHPTDNSKVASAAAVKVGSDSAGHVVIGDALTPSDIGAQAEFTDGSATIATVSSGVVTIKAGVSQSDGAIAQGSGDDITLAKVATTGTAADIAIVDSANKIAATNVEGALGEIATAIGDDATSGTVKGRIKGLEDNVGVKGTTSVLNATSVWNALDEINGNISGVFHFRGEATKTGSKLYKNNVEITGAAVGDVYTVDQEEYAWDGTKWILLGITTDLSNYYDKSQVDAKIGGISGAFHFKGVLLDSQFLNGLPNISNASEGDVYLNGSGEQFAYNGTTWVKLGFLTDLSAYSTTSQVEAMIEGALTGMYSFKGEAESLEDVVSPERGDVYVVDGTQYAWDGDNWVEISTNVDLSAYATSADMAAAIQAAKTEVVNTAAADATTKANGAKDYADELVEEINDSMEEVDDRIAALEETVDTAGTGLSAQVTAINTSLTNTGAIGSRIVALEAVKHSHDNADVLDEVTEDDWKNKIDSIKIGNEALTITNKAVTLPLATAQRAGLVVSSTADNKVSVGDDGTMSVNSLDVAKLFVATGDTFVLNGGNAE